MFTPGGEYPRSSTKDTATASKLSLTVCCHTHLQEHYVEYSRLGNVIKGQERAVAKSKYEEDVYINNHFVSCYNSLKYRANRS